MLEIEKKILYLNHILTFVYYCFSVKNFTYIQKQANALFPLNQDLLSLNTIDNVYAKKIITHKIII